MKFKSLIVFIAVCFGLVMVSIVATQALTTITSKTKVTRQVYLEFLRQVKKSVLVLKDIEISVLQVKSDSIVSDEAVDIVPVSKTQQQFSQLEQTIAVLKTNTFSQVHQDLKSAGQDNVLHDIQISSVQQQMVGFMQTGPSAMTALQWSALFTALEEIDVQLQKLDTFALDAIDFRSETLMKFSDETMSDVLITSALAAMIVILSQLFLYRSVVLRVNRLTAQFTDIASGAANLNVTMNIGGQDELTQLGEAFNGFISRIRLSLAEAVEALEELQEVSDMTEFFEVHGIVSEKLNEQAVQINLVAIASEEMIQTVSSVAESAETAAEMVQTVQGSADDGERVARAARNKISDLMNEVGETAGLLYTLSESSSSIRSVVNLIREIAEQTNLLALNAAIEAARAGDTGRGFAVVADEVRALASRTAQSTNEIEVKVNQIAEVAENTVGVMDSTVQVGGDANTLSVEASHAFRNIVESVTSMADHNVAIASATTEQKATIDDIVDNIQLINVVAQEVIPEALKKIAEQATKIEQVRHNVDLVDRALQGLRG